MGYMNPFEILGVSPSASDEEIKKAYRLLSRKYHPDANVGKPNQKEYEEKFKEVQQAYQHIMDQRQGKDSVGQDYGNPYNNGDFWGFGGRHPFGADYNPNEESKEQQYMRSALNYIQNGYYREGITVLDQIKDRNGQWYYYSAIANYKVGNNAIALDHAKTACALEPNNYYYANLLNQIQGGETRYQRRSASYGGNPSMGGSNYCTNLCMAAFCINMCCGGGAYMGMPLICCI